MDRQLGQDVVLSSKFREGGGSKLQWAKFFRNTYLGQGTLRIYLPIHRFLLIDEYKKWVNDVLLILANVALLMMAFEIGSVYFTGNFGYQSLKIVVCGTGNIPFLERFPYCESRTTGTTIFQTLVTEIFSDIDTLFEIFERLKKTLCNDLIVLCIKA